MRLIGLALVAAVLVVLAGHADGAPGTGTFKISLKGYTTQIWVTVPSNYSKSQSKKWGLLVGLHGAGQPPGSYLGGWSSGLLGSGGYVMVSPQSCTGGGVWNIDGKGDNAKECEYILKIVQKMLKDYDLNPDMIHINGFSAGSAMCGAGLAGDGSFRKFKIQSFVGFSGGFSGPMQANSDKAKETKVRIYNGTADRGHIEPSKSMYKAFKDAGYDAEHIEVPGQGHSYPLTDHRKIMNWYVSLDKVSRKKGEYLKLASEAEKELKDRDYAKAQKLFEKLQKAVGDELPDLAKKTKEGLDAIKKAQDEAIQKIEELKGASDNDKLEEYCKQVMKEFAKMEPADKAKEALKEISKSSKPAAKKPEKEKPATAPKKPEPEEETAATLLEKAKRYVAAQAYEVARKALKEIISKYPDSPEAKEAKKLLEKVESEM